MYKYRTWKPFIQKKATQYVDVSRKSYRNGQLYFLKHFSLLLKDLLCFYKCVICPVIEYGCMVWHHNDTTAQSNHLEAPQNRALRIMIHPTYHTSYHRILFCHIVKLNPSNRVIIIPRNILQTNIQPSELPPPPPPTWMGTFCLCQTEVLYCLSCSPTRTRRYCSFINFAMTNYQWYCDIISLLCIFVCLFVLYVMFIICCFILCAKSARI